MREQIKLLLLMAAVLAAVIVYAAIPTEWSIGGLILRKINLAALERPFRPAAAVPKTRIQRHLATRQTILFIGDSMLEGLSLRLGDYAKENGHTLHTVIWYSSTTERWANTQTLEHYVQQYKPTYLLICLGSNELFVNDLPERTRFIRTLAGKLSTLPFVWIGPADWNGDTGIVDIIRKEVGEEHFFDSRHLQLKRGPDHYHPTRAAAAQWMDSVAVFLQSRHCAGPLLLKKPESHHKAASTQILQPTFEGYGERASK
ncbi:SGNH/GDSL hydrolase family protein [Prevotella dentasini]|uniref:SGNH/GDSL hydrolase family protein n=1 Tax=Prevotella dentasini TaxID=589537 RepID=UPI0004691A54|nr:SGNH/GDSL hydrolase family protein [Prevotella dentasini]